MKHSTGRSLPLITVVLALVILTSWTKRVEPSALSPVPRAIQKAPVACTPPPSGMLAWWPGDGNALDIRGGNNGTLQNGATFAGGEVDQAFSLDGINDYVDVGDVDLPATFTIDAWIKPVNLTTLQMIVSKDNGAAARSYYFALETGGTLIGSVHSTTGGFTQYRTTAPIESGGIFQHVAMTYDGGAPAESKIVFYVNGASYPTAVITPMAGPPYDDGGTPENNSLSTKIGIFGDAVLDPFNGLIDEVELFSRVLSEAEVQAIFNAGTAGKCKPACTISCPADVTQGNDPGECGAAVNYPSPQTSQGCGTVDCSPGPGTFFPVGTTTVTCSNLPIILGPGVKAQGSCVPHMITESTSQTITPDNSYSCNDGFTHSDNSYWRAFNLSGSFLIDNPFDVQSIDIGIQSAASGLKIPQLKRGAKFSRSNQSGKVNTSGPGQSITIRLYIDAPGSFPSGPRTEIASGAFIIPDQSLTVANLPITGNVPAGSELVVEIFTPNGGGGRGNSFFIGSNPDPETGPSYVSAPDCMFNTPTTTSDLGFPDMHIVMNVNGCEEIASCTFTVTVQDTEAPTISCPNVTQCNDTNQCGAVVHLAPTVSDNCASPTVVCSPASGSFFPKGTTTVSCTASDGNNQSAPCTFTVTVNDCQDPTVTCPADVTRGTDPNQCSAVVNYPPPTATDNCPGVGSPTCVPASGSIFPKGTTTVSCTVMDAAKNSGSCSFTVTVNDTQPPSITCPANIMQNADPNQCSTVVVYSPPAVSDNCPGVGAPTCSPASGSTFPVGTTTVTCTVSDSSNNTATCSFLVTVRDTQPPIITCPPDITFVAPATCPLTNSRAVSFSVTASDNCGAVTVVCRNQSGAIVTSGQTFPVGTTTVTCTATDGSGNTATCSFTINGFNFCLQDEINPGNVVLINALNGDYRFCCSGVLVATGKGTATLRGCIGSIDDAKGARRVHIQWDTAANGVGEGTATVQVTPNKTVCSISDRKMTDNSCSCSNAPPVAGKQG